MNRLPAYLRRPKTHVRGAKVVPTDKGWELVTPHERQQSRVLVTARDLLNKIIEAEEELGAEAFRELSGYNYADFTDGAVESETITSGEGNEDPETAEGSEEQAEGSEEQAEGSEEQAEGSEEEKKDESATPKKRGRKTKAEKEAEEAAKAEESEPKE